MNDDTEQVADAPARLPRIRSGAIAWGLIVCATGALVLVFISSPEGRTMFIDWATGLGAGGMALMFALALGSLILLLALLSLIKRAQRAHPRA